MQANCLASHAAPGPGNRECVCPVFVDSGPDTKIDRAARRVVASRVSVSGFWQRFQLEEVTVRARPPDTSYGTSVFLARCLRMRVMTHSREPDVGAWGLAPE